MWPGEVENHGGEKKKVFTILNGKARQQSKRKPGGVKNEEKPKEKANK